MADLDELMRHELVPLVLGIEHQSDKCAHVRFESVNFNGVPVQNRPEHRADDAPDFVTTELVKHVKSILEILLFAAIAFLILANVRRSERSLIPVPRPITRAVSVAVMTETIAEDGVVLSKLISPALSRSSPSLYFSTSSIPASTVRSASSRLMAENLSHTPRAVVDLPDFQRIHSFGRVIDAHSATITRESTCRARNNYPDTAAKEVENHLGGYLSDRR